MSQVGDLLGLHCRNGVRYRTVGEVFRVVPTGRGINRKHYGEGSEIPIVDQGHGLIAGYTDDSSQALPKGKYVVFGDHTREVKWVDFSFAPGADGTKVLQTDHDVETKFAYYVLANLEIRSRGYNRHWSVARQLPFPIPPVEVQREIVRILDKFTSLCTNLVSETNLRIAQHAAYRSRLLRLEGMELSARAAVRNVSLAKIAKQYVEPVRVEPDKLYRNLGVKWYGEGVFAREPKVGRMIKAKTLYKVKPGQFVYNRMFVTEGSFGLITDDLADGVVSNEFPVFDLDLEQVNPGWLLLRFQDPATVDAAAAETRGGTKSRRRWKEKQFGDFVIDLPPLDVQETIVSQLSRFIALRDAVKMELEARRMQYEHYRDQLLSFEELAA